MSAILRPRLLLYLPAVSLTKRASSFLSFIPVLADPLAEPYHLWLVAIPPDRVLIIAALVPPKLAGILFVC